MQEEPVVFRGTTRPSAGDLPPGQRPIWPGTVGPVGSCPDRAPRSVRRTSSLDMRWPDGASGRLLLTGTGRDLVTGSSANDGDADVRVVDHARLDVTVQLPSRAIVDAAIDPDPHAVAA